MLSVHAEHVGSLLRPQELLQARTDPDFSPEQLREIENEHIKRVLKRQQEIGLTVLSDGELRRRNFMTDFNDAVAGIDYGDSLGRSWQTGSPAAVQVSSVPGVVIEKITQKKRLTETEVGFLKQHSPTTFKITLPTANQFPLITFKKGITDRVYPTHGALLWDIVPIFKAEVAALLQEGVEYIQIDAPRYSYYIDSKWREYVRSEMGVEPDQALDEAVRADNACLEGARRDYVTLAMHLCRGNNRSQWYAEGGYDRIAEKLFNTINVDRFLLEYDDERSGSFEPLRFVPADKTVVLGLVSSKRPDLESVSGLARRIDEASKHVPLERLALSPQCGFASTMEGNLLTEDEQWAKLELVVQTARQVWGE